MLRSDLCDYSDACIVFKGIITVSAEEKERDERNGQVILKIMHHLLAAFLK